MTDTYPYYTEHAARAAWRLGRAFKHAWTYAIGERETAELYHANVTDPSTASAHIRELTCAQEETTPSENAEMRRPAELFPACDPIPAEGFLLFRGGGDGVKWSIRNVCQESGVSRWYVSIVGGDSISVFCRPAVFPPSLPGEIAWDATHSTITESATARDIAQVDVALRALGIKYGRVDQWKREARGRAYRRAADFAVQAEHALRAAARELEDADALDSFLGGALVAANALIPALRDAAAEASGNRR